MKSGLSLLKHRGDSLQLPGLACFHLYSHGRRTHLLDLTHRSSDGTLMARRISVSTVKVEHAVKAEPVGEFELKGIRRPLAAYNVLAAA